ncbi:hypothetical protein [Methanoregula sp.]|uniref:hypothetical protein n=1 Tax=Methanoregula sp. TaxID=2052170 RepID=UPI0025D23CC3|nr:hypothetical protein [Methanoregula sp.]
MLCTILTFGLVLIFFDVTLIQLLFMMIVLVIVLPFLIGVVSVDEIRTKLAGKSGLLKRLDEMKFFEKTSSAKGQKAPAKPAAPSPPAKTEAKNVPGKTGGFGARVKSAFSSFGSLGTVLKERSKRGRKVEDINKMLDKTVSEKVPAPSAAPAPSMQQAAAGSASLPSPGGAGGLPADADDDSLLSLSGDEFDAGLLEGLDDDSPPVMPEEITPEGPTSGSAPDLPVPELSLPTTDEAGGSLDEFAGLEGGGGLDTEFGDLDSISLDDIDVGDDMEVEAAPASASQEDATMSGTDAGPAPAAAPAASAEPVKTAWIASDAPAGADMLTEDQIGVQSDMASFASGAGGTDEDLLSSIASDVKTVKKEKDISLLRELKDFKAPASQIEDELKGMFNQISSAPAKKDKDKPAPDGIK